MLNVTIRSLQRLLFEQWVSSVRLPGAAGEFEVLGFHVPFVAALTTGRIWIENQGPMGPGTPGPGVPGVPGPHGTRLQVLPIRGGLAWLAAERLVVLVEDAH